MNDMFSIESFIGGTSEIENKKNKSISSFESMNNDEITSMFYASIEDLDNINILNDLNKQHFNQKQQMITALNAFSEKYLYNKTDEKHAVESYLDNCIASMEINQVKPMSGLQAVVGIDRAFRHGSTVGTLVTSPLLGVGMLARELINLGFGSLIQGCRSCGTFSVGTDIFKSPKCLHRLEQFKFKHGKDAMCTPTDVKNAFNNVRTKAGFLSYILTGDTAGNDLKDIHPDLISMKTINGVTCCVTALYPYYGSMDLKQFAKYSVLIVTGMYKASNGKIKTKNICRGYLVPHGTIKAKGEESFESLLNEYAHGCEKYQYLYNQTDPTYWFKKSIGKL